jgi:hypothetical protein
MLKIFQVFTNKREGGYKVTFILITGSSNNKRYYGINLKIIKEDLKKGRRGG